MSEEIKPSVVWRTGRITVEDYDEAIYFLREARDLLIAGSQYCACGDVCAPGNCRHNPLVMARVGANAEEVYRCWHCGAAFTSENAAEHFGHSEDEVARCLEQRANGGK